MPNLVFIRWLDACYQEGERPVGELGEGVVMSSYGALIKDCKTGVTVALEPEVSQHARNPFTIPRRNIIEMRVIDADKAFESAEVVYTKKKPRRKKKEEKSNVVQLAS